MSTNFVFWACVFLADLLAIFTFWLMQDIANKGMNLPSLVLYLKEPKYYYLTFIHEFAYAEMLNGVKTDEIIIKLKKRPFSFLMDSQENDKYIEDKNFVLSVLGNEQILKEYIIKKDFDKTVYKDICAAIKVADKRKELENIYRAILVDSSTDNINKTERLFLKWLTRPFPAQKGSNEKKLTAGKNQLLLFTLSKGQIIKCDTTQKDFADCLNKLQKLNPSITAVSSAAMSQSFVRDDESKTYESIFSSLIVDPQN